MVPILEASPGIRPIGVFRELMRRHPDLGPRRAPPARPRRTPAMNGFPTRAPAELEDRPRRQQWLIDGLWARQAVGIVGGEPKCGKSFLALDIAVAVAAGRPLPAPLRRRREPDRS